MSSHNGAKFTCPKCASANVYIRDTTPYEDSIKRKRVCSDCGYIFHTIEIDADYYSNLLYGQKNSKLLAKSTLNYGPWRKETK